MKLPNLKPEARRLLDLARERWHALPPQERPGDLLGTLTREEHVRLAAAGG